MKPIRVAIVDDNELVIGGLRSMMAPFQDIVVAYSTTKPADLLGYLKTNQTDTVLMDIQMPACSGIDLCWEIVSQYPGLKVIAFSNFDDSQMVNQIMQNGALGYLLKNADQQVLRKAIETVNKGQPYVDEALNRKIPPATELPVRRSVQEIPLTKRERDILKLLSQGYTPQKIAAEFSLGLRSVELQYQQLTQKLGASTTAQMVQEGKRRGLLD